MSLSTMKNGECRAAGFSAIDGQQVRPNVKTRTFTGTEMSIRVCYVLIF